MRNRVQKIPPLFRKPDLSRRRLMALVVSSTAAFLLGGLKRIAYAYQNVGYWERFGYPADTSI